MRVRRLLTVPPLAVALAMMAPLGAIPAHAATDLDAVTCPLLTGQGNWNLPVGPVPANNVYFMGLSGNCVGTGDDAGTYTLQLDSITDIESCAAGESTGTVTGNGPEGGITGNYTALKVGNVYDAEGTFTSGGDTHAFQLAITALAVCNYTASGLDASGWIADE